MWGPDFEYSHRAAASHSCHEQMAKRFIDSAFTTRTAWEAAAALPTEAEREAAERAERHAQAHRLVELQHVGHLVELHGLKGRAELNGKRGRAVTYTPETGRVGVALRLISKFGSVERTTVALQPANLRVLEAPAAAAADGEAPLEVDEAGRVKLTWESLLRTLDLRHLRAIHWSRYEEDLANCCLRRKDAQYDVDSAKRVLEEKVGLTSPADVGKLAEALVSDAVSLGFAGGGGLNVMMRLFAHRLGETTTREDRDAEAKRAAHMKAAAGVPKADSRFRDSNGRVCEQRHGVVEANDTVRPSLPDPPKNHMKCTVYPSSAQADALAELLKRRVRLTASYSNDERVLEGMLEKRGCSVMALDSDTFQEADEYYERRIYCTEVWRPTAPPLHRSTAPPPHRSTALPLHRSTAQPPHRSTAPPLHRSTAPPLHRSTAPPPPPHAQHTPSAPLAHRSPSPPSPPPLAACAQVRRVGIDCLMHLHSPETTAMIFCNGCLIPWEAYLARYPQLPILIVIGDNDARKMHQPRPSDLEGVQGWRLLRKMTIDVYKRPPLEMHVYENARHAT